MRLRKLAIRQTLERGLITVGGVVAIGVMVMFLAVVRPRQAEPANSMRPIPSATAHVRRVRRASTVLGARSGSECGGPASAAGSSR